MAKGPNRFVPSGKLKALELQEGSGIGLSNLAAARLRFNEVTLTTELSENGGAYVPLSSSAGSPFTNVQSYGAIGDGTTDDTVAIQNAVNAYPSGGTILFPCVSAYYKISDSIIIGSNGLKFVGVGSVLPRIHQSSLVDNAFENGANHVSNISFENLWLTGQGPGGGNGIVLTSDQTYGSHHSFRGLKIGGSGAYLGFETGIILEHCMAPSINECQLWQNNHGVKLVGASNGANVIGSEFAANVQTGLYLMSAVLGGTDFPVVGANVIGNIFQSNSYASVRLARCNGNVVFGCYFEAGGAYLGIGASAYDVIVDDESGGISPIHYGNALLLNSFRGSNATTPPYLGAAHVVNGPGNIVDRNICTSNSNIVIEATANRTEINRNTMYGSSAIADSGTGTVHGGCSTVGAARPTLNLSVGDMHILTTLAPPKPVWVASLGPTVWIDSSGTVVP